MEKVSKKILAFCLFLLACVTCANEVVFIPGWFTEKAHTEEYEPLLQKI